MSGPRRVITVDDLGTAIAGHEAEGYRLVTISPADDPRRADMDGPDAIRLERRAGAAAAEGRAGMVYRDLIPDRLGGAVIASHITIPEGGPVPDYVHHHDISFQMIFCHAGWVRVVYEDQGAPFVMGPGDAVLQPPGIRHRVLESGDGLEVVEVGSPAEHDTHREHDLALPTPLLRPERDFGGQRFVRHVHDDAGWSPGPATGWEQQVFGLAAATGRRAEARVVRVVDGSGPWEVRHPDSGPVFVFVRDGAVAVVAPDPSSRLEVGDTAVFAGDGLCSLRGDPSGELLVVDLPVPD